jgi:hypothetical protein
MLRLRASNWHDLRHCFATRLRAKKVKLRVSPMRLVKKRQAWLGVTRT